MERSTERFLAQMTIRDHKLEKVENNPGMRALYIVYKGLGHPGYSWYVVTSDGEILCHDCLRDNLREIIDETKGSWGPQGTGWKVEAYIGSDSFDVDAEYCGHCSKVLYEV